MDANRRPSSTKRPTYYLVGDIVDKELDIQNSMKLILIIVACLTLGGAFAVFYRSLFNYLLLFLPWFTTFPSLFKCNN